VCACLCVCVCVCVCVWRVGRRRVEPALRCCLLGMGVGVIKEAESGVAFITDNVCIGNPNLACLTRTQPCHTLIDRTPRPR